MKKIISKLFTLGFILFCSSGCGGDSGIGKFLGVAGNSDVQLTLIQCSGLNDHPASLKFMSDSLGSSFTVSNTIGRDAEDTDKKALQAQSDGLFEKIKKEEPDKKKVMVFLAHSQGGLVAYPVAQKLKKEGYKVLVITIGTPWEGVHALKILSEVSEKRKHAEEIKEEIKTIKKLAPVDDIIRYYEEKLEQEFSGILDMKPGSKFLKDIHAELARNKIPILAIGGDISKLAQDVLSIEQVPAEFKTAYNSFNKLVGDPKHDLLIRLSSQQAKNIKKTNFEVATVEAAHFPIPKSLIPSELTSREVINKIKDFINRKAK